MRTNPFSGVCYFLFLNSPVRPLPQTETAFVFGKSRNEKNQMSASILLVFVIVSFFIFITIAVLEMERSYKANILGGLAVLWVVIALFLLAVFFTKGTAKVAQPAQADETVVR